MLSISKILALIAILGVVWYGFKLVGRLDQARKRKVDREPSKPSGRTASEEPRETGVLDLVKDETGAYVSKDKRDDRV